MLNSPNLNKILPKSINCQNSKNETLLHIAISSLKDKVRTERMHENDLLSTIRLLLRLGCDPFLTDNDGNTAFHHCAINLYQDALEACINSVLHDHLEFPRPRIKILESKESIGKLEQALMMRNDDDQTIVAIAANHMVSTRSNKMLEFIMNKMKLVPSFNKKVAEWNHYNGPLAILNPIAGILQDCYKKI